MKKALLLLSLLLFVTNSLFAQYFCPVPKGTIHRAYIEYENSGWVNIKTGYGECNGKYWELWFDTPHQVTSLASTAGFHYIYIDDTASTYPTVSFTDSSTAPSWSDEKQGWYYSNDRCIGVVWSPAGSATIQQFTTDAEGKYIYIGNITQILTNGNPTGGWVFLNASDYTPVNANAISIWATGQDVNATVKVLVASSDNAGNSMGIFGFHNVGSSGWIFFQPDSDRNLQWFGYDDDDNLFNIYIRGYKIIR
ncbi:MAG: hypothetical protein RBU23_11565 [Candidatus Auribacterota bacterium]|jgi:hypothetical protein|nr:hypothetical protein [Candidatus Auribacterota bacterium]